MTEAWRPIPTCPGYEASSLGGVRSVDRTILRSNGVPQRWRGVLLRQKVNPQTGYLQVTVRRDGRSGVSCRVHVLVLEAFTGPRPDGMVCRHLNDRPDDNRIENLAWGTQAQNNADMVRNGLHWHLKKTNCPRGHPYNDLNTYHIGSRSSRYCKACQRLRSRTQSVANTKCKKGHPYPPEILRRIETREKRRYCPICIANRTPRRDRVKQKENVQ